MPLCAFDIASDGSATPASEGPVPHGQYRWTHFDLSDADLPAFLQGHVPDIPAAALMASQTRPRCDAYDDGLILNLRGVNLNVDGPADQMVAVRMWVTPDTVITVRMRRVFALNAMRQEAEAGHAPSSPMGFVGALTAALMGRVRDTVFDLGVRVDTMEDDMIEETGVLPADLADDRRMAIRFRRYMGPQRDALMALIEVKSPMISKGQRARLREQANIANLSVEELDSLVSRMTAVQDHHDAETARLQTRNGYVVSLVAAVFLPLGFVTGLFGVNVGGMPGVGSDLAFAILCAALVVLIVLVIWVLRHKRWL